MIGANNIYDINLKFPTTNNFLLFFIQVILKLEKIRRGDIMLRTIYGFNQISKGLSTIFRPRVPDLDNYKLDFKRKSLANDRFELTKDWVLVGQDIRESLDKHVRK